MSDSAEFTIDDTPYSQRGIDVIEGDGPQLLIADPVGVFKVEFQVFVATKYAGTPSFAPGSGIQPDPVTPVTFNVGSPTTADAPYGYIIRCIKNNGVRIVRDVPTVVPEWTKDRAIVIRSPSGQRPIFVGETREYDPDFGWTSAFDDLSITAGDAANPPLKSWTSGTPTLELGKINVLSGTVAGAVLPPVPLRGTIVVKKFNLGAIDITPDGSEKIDAASTYTLAAGIPYATVTLVADNINGRWLAFPPA